MENSSEIISKIIDYLDPEKDETGYFCPHSKKIYAIRKNGDYLVEVSPEKIDFMECMEEFLDCEITNEKIEEELVAALNHSQPLYSYQNIFYENEEVKKKWDKFKYDWLKEQAIDLLEDYS